MLIEEYLQYDVLLAYIVQLRPIHTLPRLEAIVISAYKVQTRNTAAPPSPGLTTSLKSVINSHVRSKTSRPGCALLQVLFHEASMMCGEGVFARKGHGYIHESILGSFPSRL